MHTHAIICTSLGGVVSFTVVHIELVDGTIREDREAYRDLTNEEMEDKY